MRLIARRHRRREQCDLARRRRLLQDRLDVVDEAHAQHLVGFVQHQRLELRQIQRAVFQVIDHAARRADDDVHAAAQRAQLRTVALAAVDRQHVEAGQVRGVALEGLGHLDRQFARRRQHQRLRLASARCRCGTGSAARRRRSCRCRSAPGPARRGWPAASGMVAAWIGDGVS